MDNNQDYDYDIELARKIINDLLIFKSIPEEELKPLIEDVKVALCMYINYIYRVTLRYGLINMYYSVDDEIAKEFAVRLYQYLSDYSDIIRKCLELKHESLVGDSHDQQ